MIYHKPWQLIDCRLHRWNVFPFVCVGKMANEDIIKAKDMPGMKRAFPKGSSVQVFCFLSNKQMSQGKQEWKRRIFILWVFWGSASKLGSSWKHLFFVKDKLFIMIGFSCQFHTQVRKNLREREWFIIQLWYEQLQPLNCECTSWQILPELLQNLWQPVNVCSLLAAQTLSALQQSVLQNQFSVPTIHF